LKPINNLLKRAMRVIGAELQPRIPAWTEPDVGLVGKAIALLAAGLRQTDLPRSSAAIQEL
jgi:hypothetical protein